VRDVPLGARQHATRRMTGRVAWRVAGALVVAAAALPIPAWVGARDVGPIWLPNVSSWAIGLVVVLLLGLIAGRGAVHRTERRLRRLPDMPLADGLLVAVLAVAVTLAAAVTSLQVFAGNPHLVDEMAQLLHARAFAAGRLALAVPDPAGAFLITHTGIAPAGWVSQYPPGQTVLLTAGLLAGLPWLVNPLLGGLAVPLIYLTARGLYGRTTARAAAVLWVLSAWVLFTSASYMNHVGAVTFALAAWAAVLAPGRPGRRRLVLAGLAVGGVTVTRPLDGVAAMIPILWVIAAGRDWRALPWVVLGGLPVAAVWAWFNAAVFHDPLTLGYSLLYGAEHGLGFHRDPWGFDYTPQVALSNAAVALRRVTLYLYEWPIPALLPAVLWALAADHRRRSDLTVLAGAVAAPLLYGFYWHSGFFLGPRFYYVAVPMFVIATARAWRWLLAAGRRAPRGHVDGRMVVLVAGLVTVTWGAIGVLPYRWRSYRDNLPTMKQHPARALAHGGIGSALVLVQESWGSRIVVRLWAAGASPGLVERAYGEVDACVLDSLAANARRERWPAARTVATLEALLVVAAERPDTLTHVVRWPDPTLRLDPAHPLSSECAAEMRRDLDGFTTFGQLAWRNPVNLRDGIVFARDLPELRDSLMSMYADRPIYRWAPPPATPDSLPVLTLMRPAP